MYYLNVLTEFFKVKEMVSISAYSLLEALKVRLTAAELDEPSSVSDLPGQAKKYTFKNSFSYKVVNSKLYFIHEIM